MSDVKASSAARARCAVWRMLFGQGVEAHRLNAMRVALLQKSHRNPFRQDFGSRFVIAGYRWDPDPEGYRRADPEPSKRRPGLFARAACPARGLTQRNPIRSMMTRSFELSYTYTNLHMV